jgi:hypothetical protein
VECELKYYFWSCGLDLFKCQRQVFVSDLNFLLMESVFFARDQNDGSIWAEVFHLRNELNTTVS